MIEPTLGGGGALRSLKLRTTLPALFAAMAAISAVLGWVGYIYTTSLARDLQVTNEKWLLSAHLVDGLKTNIVSFRASEAARLLGAGEGITESENSFSLLEAAIGEGVKAYEKLMLSEEESVVFYDFRVAWDNYTIFHDRVVRLLNDDKGADARRLFSVESRESFEQASSLLQQLFSLNHTASQKQYEVALSLVADARLYITLLVLAALVVTAVVASLVQSRIILPIEGMTDVMVRIVHADFGVAVPATDRADVIGEMARSIEVYRLNGIAGRKLREEQEQNKLRDEAERRTAIASLADTFHKSIGGVIDGLSSTSKELEGAARGLTSTANSTKQLTMEVASTSSQMSASVSSVAAATEQLSATVKEIGVQINTSAKVAISAVDQSEQVDRCMTELADAARHVGGVVDLITEIADQTNLLALNATIEAARAGEAGKGFAVVAQEVKQLADQTRKATSNITAQVNAMQGVTLNAVNKIKDVRETVGTISHITSTIAAAVEQQGAATAEIAGNVHQAASGTQKVAGSITRANKGAIETEAASSQVLTSAEVMLKKSSTLQEQVNAFLMRVRAA